MQKSKTRRCKQANLIRLLTLLLLFIGVIVICFFFLVLPFHACSFEDLSFGAPERASVKRQYEEDSVNDDDDDNNDDDDLPLIYCYCIIISIIQRSAVNEPGIKEVLLFCSFIL